MNEWNIRERDLKDPHAPAGKRSERVVFCPACSRPFLRGTGVRPEPGASGPGVEEGPEHCSRECLPR